MIWLYGVSATAVDQIFYQISPPPMCGEMLQKMSVFSKGVVQEKHLENIFHHNLKIPQHPCIVYIFTYIYHKNQPFQIPWGIWRWWNTLLGSSGPCYLLDIEHVTYLRPPTAQHICTQTHTHTLASLASQTAAVVALADLTRLEEKMNTPEVRAYFVPWQMSDKRDASMWL